MSKSLIGIEKDCVLVKDTNLGIQRYPRESGECFTIASDNGILQIPIYKLPNTLDPRVFERTGGYAEIIKACGI